MRGPSMAACNGHSATHALAAGCRLPCMHGHHHLATPLGTPGACKHVPRCRACVRVADCAGVPPGATPGCRVSGCDEKGAQRLLPAQRHPGVAAAHAVFPGAAPYDADRRRHRLPAGQAGTPLTRRRGNEGAATASPQARMLALRASMPAAVGTYLCVFVRVCRAWCLSNPLFHCRLPVSCGIISALAAVGGPGSDVRSGTVVWIMHVHCWAAVCTMCHDAGMISKHARARASHVVSRRH